MAGRQQKGMFFKFSRFRFVYFSLFLPKVTWRFEFGDVALNGTFNGFLSGNYFAPKGPFLLSYHSFLLFLGTTPL